MSELLGKETIDTNTYGKTVGHSGSYSTNYQLAGRELLTQDEIRMLDNEKAILMIRGEKPIIDRKYNILKHPNVKYTTDGQAKPYEHAKIDRVNASISKLNFEEIEQNKLKYTQDIEKFKIISELLSDEEIENYYIMEEYQNEREKENNK